MSAILDWLYGADDLQKQGDTLDGQLRDINERDYGPGGRYYTPDNYTRTQDNLASGATGDVSQQLDDAFQEGLDEGANNVTGVISGAFKLIGKGLGAVLLGVPAWAWLLGIVALWVYLGAPGLRQLKGKFA